MKYILDKEGIQLDRYLAYLETIRTELPEHVYEFASNPCHYDLSSHHSLHDAWLENFSIREIPSGARQEVRRVAVSLSLLGPFHDRRIHLHYDGVRRYCFEAPPRDGEPRFEHIAHGDLLTHETRLGERGHVVHELFFERGGTFLVECSDFRHSEEML